MIAILINKFPLIVYRDHYPPAEEYVNHVDRSHVTLVEAFKHMQLDVEEPHENGELDDEVHLKENKNLNRG